jgi:hypothetical protein
MTQEIKKKERVRKIRREKIKTKRNLDPGRLRRKREKINNKLADHHHSS